MAEYSATKAEGELLLRKAGGNGSRSWRSSHVGRDILGKIEWKGSQ